MKQLFSKKLNIPSIFEIKEEYLKKSINFLEFEEDKNEKWRNFVKEKLKELNKIFQISYKFDLFIFLKVDSFETVVKNRQLQEKKLKLKKIENPMTIQEVNRFCSIFRKTNKKKL